MSIDDNDNRPQSPENDEQPRGRHLDGMGLRPDPEDDGEQQPPARRSPELVWVLGLCTLVILLAALAAGFFFGGDSGAPTQGQEMPVATHEARGTVTPPDGGPATQLPTDDEQQDTPSRPYEETLGIPLERLVRQIDYALIETLLFTGYDPHAMTIREMRVETYHDEQYHFQAVDIELENGPTRFLEILGRSLTKWAPEAELNQTGATEYEITVAGRVTHALSFATAEPRPSEIPQGGGLLALVIDDMGQDLRFARELAALPFPVTFSVLPGTPHGHEVAALALKSGRELLLHLPMEPKGWPGINPGPGALFTTMAPDELRRVLAADLADVPGAVGVNNHMGSRFTSDRAGMALVLAELKARDMFFLDSLTAQGSTAVRQGQELDLPVYRRNIFLDNVRDVAAITRQLEKAERVAVKLGQAVAIGHPYPETLAALKQWAERSNRPSRIVHVGELNPLH